MQPHWRQSRAYQNEWAEILKAWSMRAALKVVPPILLCWFTMTKVGAGRLAVGGWTFLTIFHYILLLFARWQQRGSLTKWCLIWKCVWSKGVSLNSSMWKKMAPIDIHQHLLYVYEDETVDVSTTRWWVVCFSSDDSNSGLPLLVQIFIQYGMQACLSLVKMHT